MSDKEVLINAVCNYVGATSSKLFGIKFGQAGSAIIKMGINNILGKKKYSMITDFFFDENDNIPSIDDFFEAFKEIVNQKPLVIANIKFSGDDIEEIRKIFIENK